MSIQGRDFGSRTGSGGQMSVGMQEKLQKQQMLQMTEEAFKEEVAKDPYVKKSQMNTYECLLCCSIHPTIGSYIAHKALRKHLVNVKRYENKKALSAPRDGPLVSRPKPQRRAAILGTPAYTLKKQRDLEGRPVLLVEVRLPEILAELEPRWRVVSWFEQQVEAQDDRWKYLLVAAEPYETIAVRIPNKPINDARTYEKWFAEEKVFALQIVYQDPL